MSGVNKVILVGRVGKDPELINTATGVKVCKLSIATSDSYKDKTTGDKHDKTEWHNITCFDRLAEIAGEYVRKGSLVYIEGKLCTTKYTHKDGGERYSTAITASSMQMLSSKSSTDTIESKDGEQDGAAGRASDIKALAAGFHDDDIPF